MVSHFRLLQRPLASQGSIRISISTVSALLMTNLASLLTILATSSYTSNIIGAVSSLFCFGCAVGAILQGWTSDWLGRKGAISLAAGLTLVGGALIAGSVNVPMLIVMRLLQGLGVGQLISLVPLYITEVAPPHRRGVLSGLTACSLTLGYIS